MDKKNDELKTDQILTRIDKNIKLLQYSLSKIVTTFKDFHILLTPQNPVCIDLIEQTPIYCKIDTRGRVPPVKVQIEFKDAP
jgi:hypothetical protein